MTIEYQIKRIDLVKAYFYNLRHSKRTQMVIFGFTAFLIVQTLFLNYRSQGHLALTDIVAAFLIALGFMMMMPVLLFLMAKTQKRILSINPEGIETKIGSKEGKIPWKSVEQIKATEDRIIIVGKTANAFTIPFSAFTSAEQKQAFWGLAIQYHANSNQNRPA